MMNRRSFLALLAASLTLDPERMLWIPGRKLISVPKPRARGNRFLTSDMILDMAMERYAVESAILMLADSRYDACWKREKIGDTIRVRTPFRRVETYT